MGIISLYQITDQLTELQPKTEYLESFIQKIVETNMEKLFSAKFVKREYVTSKGRMDSIGVDENHCPVIFEYKRSASENIINQGLSYLDWLLDHKGDFQLLVRETLGEQAERELGSTDPSVICIAKDFTRYDEDAIAQMGKNIRLVKYNIYDDNLLLFEFVNAPAIQLCLCQSNLKDYIMA